MRSAKLKQSLTKRLLGFFALILTFPTLSYGGEIEGPRVLGLGGAYSAVANDSNAVRENPAGIATSKVYTATLAYQKINNGPQNKNITIVDSRTNKLAVGLSLTRENEGNGKKEFGILSFAENYSGFFIGLSAKHFNDKESNEKDHSYDVGILMVPSKNFSLGLVGKNMSATKFDYIHKSHTAGLSYNFSPSLKTSLDYTKDRDVSGEDDILSMGLEYSYIKELALRGGFRDHNISGIASYSLGMTWQIPQGTFEYGYQWEKNNSSNKTQAFSASFNF